MSRRIKLLLTFSLAISACIHLMAQASREPITVHQLYEEDQNDRTQLGKAISPTQMTARDEKRRTQLRALMNAGALKSAEDFHDAAFILQHGQEPSDYLLAHVLAVAAIEKGDARSKWISAATLDRYLHSIGQPQIFGTQYPSKGFQYFQQHRKDPEALQKSGWRDDTVLQTPYDEQLISDSIRVEFCVLNREQQSQNVADMNAGRSPKRMIPDGCTR